MSIFFIDKLYTHLMSLDFLNLRLSLLKLIKGEVSVELELIELCGFSLI